MRLSSRVAPIVTAIVLSAFLARPARAQAVSALPGDSGTIKVAYTNDFNSAGPVLGLHLVLSAPGFVSAGSPDTVDLAPGQSHTFLIQYSISNAAPAGSFSITMTPEAATTNTSPQLSELGGSVAFSINATTPYMLPPAIDVDNFLTIASGGPDNWDVLVALNGYSYYGFASAGLYRKPPLAAPELLQQIATSSVSVQAVVPFSYPPVGFDPANDYLAVISSNTNGEVSENVFRLLSGGGGVGATFTANQSGFITDPPAGVFAYTNDNRSAGVISQTLLTPDSIPADPQPGYATSCVTVGEGVDEHCVITEGGAFPSGGSGLYPLGTVQLQVATSDTDSSPSGFTTVRTDQVYGTSTGQSYEHPISFNPIPILRYSRTKVIITGGGADVPSYTECAPPPDNCDVIHYFYHHLYISGGNIAIDGKALSFLNLQYNTPAGSDVSVPIAPFATITFAEVTAPWNVLIDGTPPQGGSGVTRMDLVRDGALPPGESIPPGAAFRLKTNATVSGSATLSIYYRDLLSGYISPERELQASLVGPGVAGFSVSTITHLMTAQVSLDGTGVLGTYAIQIPPDTIPPGQISDLALDYVPTAENPFQFGFASVGDDGSAGPGANYQLAATRNGSSYSSSYIPGAMTGMNLTASLGALPPGKYSFAVTAVDFAGNTSSSNVVTYDLPNHQVIANADFTAFDYADMAILSTESLKAVELSSLTATLGLALLSEPVSITAPEGSFASPATLVLGLNPILAATGAPPESLKVYAVTADGQLEFPPQSVNAAQGELTVAFSTANMAFGIFGSTAGAADQQPPSTALQYSATLPGDGGALVTIPSDAQVTLTAIDDAQAGATPSGVAATYYAVDQVSTDTAIPYAAPFLLPLGSHHLVYFSRDLAGNGEAPKSADISVVPAGRGLALGADQNGRLWEVARSSDPNQEQVWAAAFSTAGVVLSTTALPGALARGEWSVQFANGDVFVIGTASGSATHGADAAVYKIAPDGTLLGRSVADGGGSDDDQSFGSSSGLWVAGAAADHAGALSMALWHYDPASGAFALRSTASGGAGLDAGFGVTVDAAGSVWVVGYSSDPAPAGAAALDLALWRFDSTGQSLQAGPFLQRGYASQPTPTLDANVLAVGSFLEVAAVRVNPLGDSDLARLRFNSSGVLRELSYWHGAPGTDEVPHALAAPPTGGLQVVGGSGAGNAPVLADWSYDGAGALGAARTISGAGTASGLAYSGGQTWLAVDSQAAPLLLAASAALAGNAGLAGSMDSLPPVTSLGVSGASATVSGRLLFIAASTVTLSAVDPLTSSSTASGVFATYYLVDADTGSCAATPLDEAALPGSCAHPFYDAPFSLPLGTHTVAYFSEDYEGNAEPWRFVEVTAASVLPVSGDFGGLAVGFDASSRGWVVFRDSETVAFARVNADGAATSSVTLPGADSKLPWSVFFDGSGNPYAVGSAQGANGADLLAVYEASPSGAALVSSRTFDSGFGRNNFVFASSPQGWIVGAVQTQGPLDQSGPSAFSAAIWRFDPDLGAVQLSTTYARAGLDVATSLAVDDSGNLWVAGFSLSPAPRTANSFDLALWKYSPDGTTLLAGPYLREGYLSDFDATRTAQVHFSSGTVFVSSPRSRAAGGTDVAFVAFDASDGHVLAENAWRPNDGSSVFPSALARDSAGDLLAAGSFDYGDGTVAGFWRYGQNGAFETATQTGTGGVQSSAYDGPDLWAAVDGSSTPARVSSESPAAGFLLDVLPPRTQLVAGTPSFQGDRLYISSNTLLGLTALDDQASVGDGLGAGVSETSYAADDALFAAYSSSFSLVDEGTHTVSFYSTDTNGNLEAIVTTSVAVDLTPPSVVLVSSGAGYAVSAQDPAVNGAAAGVGQINYLIDAVPDDCQEVPQSTAATAGSCANLTYAGPFTLAGGTHTVYFQAIDRVGNGQDVITSSFVVVGGGGSLSLYAVIPATGPIGIPFSISGSSFGAYAGSNTRVKFGATVAPISVWNDTTIKGTIPGLSTGTYAVAIERQTGSTVTALSAGDFSVQLPSAAAITASSAPIGAPFSISGTGFGPYAGTRTLLLIGESTAPVSVWNDAKLSGTVPGLSTGTYPVRIVRTTADGGVMTVTPFSFEVVAPAPDSFAPLSGPIGVPFTVTGTGFGPYAGTNTRIVFDGVRAPVSVWNDAAIKGTIPDLPPGEHPVWIERASSDGGLQSSDTAYFTVTVPSVTSVSPSSGPIGATFTLAGGSFGPYAGSLTRLLIGGTTAPVSVWNDATIKGTVPGTLTAGVQPVVVERLTTDGGLTDSATVYFQVLAPFGANLTPTAGPIGVPFTVTGSGFGAYAGSNTLLVVGQSTAAVSVWNDTTISGTIPALATGTYSVAVERFQGTGMAVSVVAEFEVTPLVLPVPSPSSGPIGAPFTLLGSGFGPYAGTNTRLLLGGTTVAVSVWNDAQISGTVPTAAAGPQPLWIERLSGSGLESSDTVYFQVVVASVAGVSPSSGPIGVAFTVTGSGFGPYAGSNTQVLIGGTTTPVSVWNDSTIVGTVPGSLPTGAYELTVARRASDGGIVQSAPVSFQVTGMNLDDLTPVSGPIGVPFTIHGSQFGAYQGSNTRVRFGAVTAAVSVWNDSTISGTIPALATGTYSVAVERQQGSAVAVSNASTFTVSDYSFTGLTPSSGPIGVPFTITGAGFGPYAGSNTRLLLGGTTVAVSVWNDGRITGTVPPVPPGSQPLWIERLTGGGVQSSDTAYFLVSVPTVETLTPSSAPIGAPFTLHGTSFGSYAGSNTRVKFGALLAPISVWNDSTISGTVPGAASTGAVTVVVERASGAGLTQSATQAFVVVAPSVSTMTPLSGPPGTVVTLSGSGFGPYAGSATTVLIGGSTTPVSVWNDSTIHWTVPSALADGTYPVLVVRSPSGGTIQSEPLDFTVDSGGGAGALFATTSLALQPAVNFQGDLSVSTAAGGRVQTPSQAAVEVPPGALEKDTEITLDRDRSTHKKDREKALEHDKLGSAGEAISFGPEGTRFAVPVTIELPYDPDLVPPGKLHELAVNYFDPTTKTWTPLDSQVDEVRHVVSARTSHFSLYQPLGHGIGVQAASTVFGFKAVYAFPNPVRGAGAVTIRVQPGQADSVSVRVYDASGHKVHESSDFALNPNLDDGNGLGAQYTYDHVWSVAGVGSGVYTYAVTAKKAGQRDIHKTGRVGVVK